MKNGLRRKRIENNTNTEDGILQRKMPPPKQQQAIFLNVKDGLLHFIDYQLVTISLPYSNFSIGNNRRRSIVSFGQNSLSAGNEDARPDKQARDYGQRCTVLTNHTHRSVQRDFRTMASVRLFRSIESLPFVPANDDFLASATMPSATVPAGISTFPSDFTSATTLNFTLSPISTSLA